MEPTKQQSLKQMSEACQETTDDPLLPRELWRPIIWEFVLELAEQDPEKFDLVAIR
jgi:hypothetical protein